MATDGPQIIMPQVGAAPMSASVTVGRQMRRAEGIMMLGALVGAYGFVEGSKPAKWVGLGALGYGAWSWWKSYQQNKALDQARTTALAAGQLPAIRAGAPGDGFTINGLSEEGLEPSSALPPNGRSVRSVPKS